MGEWRVTVTAVETEGRRERERKERARSMNGIFEILFAEEIRDHPLKLQLQFSSQLNCAS